MWLATDTAVNSCWDDTAQKDNFNTCKYYAWHSDVNGKRYFELK